MQPAGVPWTQVHFHSRLQWRQSANSARGEGRLPLAWSSKALSSVSKTRDAVGVADPRKVEGLGLLREALTFFGGGVNQ